MKILVTGANGQLGTEVVTLLKEEGIHTVFPFIKEELDISNEQEVSETISSIHPDWIFHCAAYTNVEAAEEEGREANWRINRDGSAYISKAAAEIGARVIYISTDYIFDGTKEAAYLPSDQTNPINQYGAAKLAGEEAILKYSPSAYIIRTSWVFGEHGRNFVYTMLNLAKKMDTIKVVNDQYGKPTYAHDLAAFMVYIVNHEVEAGVYHFSNDGVATWFEFAKEILKGKRVEVLPGTSAEFPQKAARPKHSVLSLDKVKDTGFVIPTWRDALERFMRQRVH
ncbi:dTDP-4-dehydrorhamnose reductase [Pradoshia sp. D12]|uniref:dTDP-4-dehydrorhamnose reductase n=1 Tax=Bacillaceae TaxID=186817 RepID=UPI0011274BED|nr:MULTISPECIES: dTDP-4-dehydrorhamnose reductase [Bacillaceae]QFK72882.1 dTDP-4-dehydrorhamnose reductase [Pradoshia sp. D12]TPF71874.1 dTDP-4-dehydrorhamnose reductase [Bacillus sp. D12]